MTKRILIISGSRADYGMLEWPAKVLAESFDVRFFKMRAKWPGEAFNEAQSQLIDADVDCLLILGDRWEILQTALAAHLWRIPIAHLCGGDVTLGSYDDAMRDCISRLATWHFPSSEQSADRLKTLGYKNVYMVGSTGVDYIMHADWKRERPYPEPYVVISYQPETIETNQDHQEIGRIFAALPLDIRRVFIRPNADRGSDLVNDIINGYEKVIDVVCDSLPHAEFLNLLYHCEEFIGNSSAIFYEAPLLGVKTKLIGKRQAGRVEPLGDGTASERICGILKRELN